MCKHIFTLETWMKYECCFINNKLFIWNLLELHVQNKFQLESFHSCFLSFSLVFSSQPNAGLGIFYVYPLCYFKIPIYFCSLNTYIFVTSLLFSNICVRTTHFSVRVKANYRCWFVSMLVVNESFMFWKSQFGKKSIAKRFVIM